MELLGLSPDYTPADIGRGALALFLGSPSCSCAGAKPAAIAAAVRSHYEAHQLAGCYPGDPEDLRTSVARYLRQAAADAPERFYEHPDKTWTIAPPGQTADPHRNFVTVDRRHVKKGEIATAELKERKSWKTTAAAAPAGYTKEILQAYARGFLVRYTGRDEAFEAARKRHKTPAAVEELSPSSVPHETDSGYVRGALAAA